MNHEVTADHALLLSEAADVLLDMAMSPANRQEDLEDVESIQAEAAHFGAESGLPGLLDAMFDDVVAIARGLAAHTDPLPPPMVMECRAVMQIARTLSGALEAGPDARQIIALSRAVVALDPGSQPGIDLESSTRNAATAVHRMRQEWSSVL